MIDQIYGYLVILGGLTDLAKNINTLTHTAGHLHAYDRSAKLHEAVTLDGYWNLLAEAEKYGARRFIYSLSVAYQGILPVCLAGTLKQQP